MYDPPLLRDRPRRCRSCSVECVRDLRDDRVRARRVSSTADDVWSLIAAMGAVVAVFKHQDGWGGADRGLVGGAVYGIALLGVHALVGTIANVSLRSFPPRLAVLTAVAGMLFAALCGRIARGQPDKAWRTAMPNENAAP
jgi:hypothetical protein